MSSEHDAYHELCGYTLTHRGATFIHQHVVDAFAAQQARRQVKPIALTFALVGLFLHVERGLTGRQVQQVHMRLARRKRQWPAWPLPSDRGAITAADILAAAPGEERDRAIDAWCASVWRAFDSCRGGIVELLKKHGIDGAAGAYRDRVT